MDHHYQMHHQASERPKYEGFSSINYYGLFSAKKVGTYINFSVNTRPIFPRIVPTRISKVSSHWSAFNLLKRRAPDTRDKKNEISFPH